jgi:hypothetical protein
VGEPVAADKLTFEVYPVNWTAMWVE